VLKLAIVRVNDDTGRQRILATEPLHELLAEAAREGSRWGFRDRHVKRVLAHLAAAEDQMKGMSIRLQ